MYVWNCRLLTMLIDRSPAHWWMYIDMIMCRWRQSRPIVPFQALSCLEILYTHGIRHWERLGLTLFVSSLDVPLRTSLFIANSFCQVVLTLRAYTCLTTPIRYPVPQPWRVTSSIPPSRRARVDRWWCPRRWGRQSSWMCLPSRSRRRLLIRSISRHSERVPWV